MVEVSSDLPRRAVRSSRVHCRVDGFARRGADYWHSASFTTEENVATNLEIITLRFWRIERSSCYQK